MSQQKPSPHGRCRPDCPPLAEPREPWAELLDELDRQLVRSHPEFGLGNQPSGIWAMNDILASFGDLGPMPAPLVDRAARIAAQYDDAFVRINAAKRIVGDHLDMLSSVKGRQHAAPVYLDRVG
jgi:hypothetical protein